MFSRGVLACILLGFLLFPSIMWIITCALEIWDDRPCKCDVCRHAQSKWGPK